MALSNSEGKILLAVDGGGTQTRCAAYSLDGVELAAAVGGPSNHLSTDRVRVLESLETTLVRTLDLCGRQRSDVLLVSGGFAGVDYDGAGEVEIKALLREAGFADSVINGDMVTAHRGALLGQPGVLAIAGTGSVFFGVSALGKQIKLGGFGYAFGDEGSGYWIANQAMRAASKAYDQRGEPTRLVEFLGKALGVSDFARVPTLLYSEPLQPARIAELSPLVESAAVAGDLVAIQILERAGHELATGAIVLAQRLGDDSACTISYHGAVLQKCAFVFEAFCKELKRRIPAAAIEPPAANALYGAYLLGKAAIDSYKNR